MAAAGAFLDFSELIRAAGTHQQAKMAGVDAGCTTEHTGPVFVVTEVINATGGRTGCFLYRGRLASAAPRAGTPDACCPLPRTGSADSLLAGVQEVPQCALGGPSLADDDSVQVDLSAYEGQELTLYLSYEEASPKAKQRGSAAAARAALAPWRVILRDAADDMLFCLRGLPHHAQLDEQLRLACWGASVAVAFPTAADARAFAAGLSRVEVQECSLAHTPAAAALEADAAAQALAGARCKAPASCPPSPARAEHPLAGGKRKAETAGLQTPMVKPLKLALITPTCSADLAAFM